MKYKRLRSILGVLVVGLFMFGLVGVASAYSRGGNGMGYGHMSGGYGMYNRGGNAVYMQRSYNHPRAYSHMYNQYGHQGYGYRQHNGYGGHYHAH